MAIRRGKSLHLHKSHLMSQVPLPIFGTDRGKSVSPTPQCSAQKKGLISMGPSNFFNATIPLLNLLISFVEGTTRARKNKTSADLWVSAILWSNFELENCLTYIYFHLHDEYQVHDFQHR